MQEFFNMGGYAFFVWTSYGLALVVLVINIILPMLKEGSILRALGRKARRRKYDNTDKNA